MSEQAVLRDRAKELVRKILTETFGQKMDNKAIAAAAEKIIRAVPVSSRKGYPASAANSSNDQT